MTLSKSGLARGALATVVAVAVGAAEASRLWPVAYDAAVVPVGVGASAVDGLRRRVRGSVACSTTAADASSSMEGMVALVRVVAAIEGRNANAFLFPVCVSRFGWPF